MKTNWKYKGDFNHLSNTAANKKGSIHDDEPAQKLGFKGAFVPGSVVGAYAMTAVINRFGKDWFNNGWFDFNFVSPVYTSDEVVTTASEAEGDVIECNVFDRQERLCCIGRAGTGSDLPWSDDPGDESIFPNAKLGTQFQEHSLTIEYPDVEPLLDAACDSAGHWRDHIHPEHLMPIALKICDFKLTPFEGVRPPGMWAQHALFQREPLPYGDYRMTEYLAEKGASGRTHFMTFQFHLFDASDREVAVGRHKCKFIREAQ
jgi:hypothetical protein